MVHGGPAVVVVHVNSTLSTRHITTKRMCDHDVVYI